MSEPEVGEMILYDAILPPLLDNSYRMTVKTDVTIEGAVQDLADKQSFFNIEGPRFSVPATEVGGVFPPRNGHGPFQESIPQIALYRRTLPWERQLESGNLIGTPTRTANDPPPPNGPVPWLALLVFEENEYVLLQNRPLEEIVPHDVFTRLGSPAGVTCDAVETNLSLLNSIIPSKEELQLLAHVRQVNINDRELSAGDSDGYFAVVMSNRLPNLDSKCRACLVSLEERSDIVLKDPPRTASPSIFVGGINFENAATRVGEIAAADARPLASAGEIAVTDAAPSANVQGAIGGIVRDPGDIFLRRVRLVCLYSWQFACIGPGTFRDLMQRLNVGMIGKVEEPGRPALTDTAHIKIDVQNRVGVPEKVWYRGPLVPFQLTRDPHTYHSADQARRATPETGAEDVSYAAAFEVGRLMAAADPRLAQELMRWRREAYRQSSRADAFTRVETAIELNTSLDLHAPIAPLIATRVVEKIAQGAGPVADPFGLNAVSSVVGLDPDAVRVAFNLSSADDAVSILGGDAGALGAIVTAPPQTARANATLEGIAADTASLERLSQSRDRMIENTQTKLRGQK